MNINPKSLDLILFTIRDPSYEGERTVKNLSNMLFIIKVAIFFFGVILLKKPSSNSSEPKNFSEKTYSHLFNVGSLLTQTTLIIALHDGFVVSGNLYNILQERSVVSYIPAIPVDAALAQDILKNTVFLQHAMKDHLVRVLNSPA